MYNIIYFYYVTNDALHSEVLKSGVKETNIPNKTVLTITTKVVSSNHFHGEVYSMQHYVIKFVSDLRQVDGFLRYSCFLHQ
jgi:hypothetical protein